MAELYFSTTTEQSRELTRREKKGELKRLYRGVYTDASYEELTNLVLRDWAKIVNYLLPNAIAAYRTAHELRPVESTVFVADAVAARRTIDIASILTIYIWPGSTSDLVEPFLPEMKRSAPARQYLENLTVSRSKVKKSLGQSWVEERLCIELKRTNNEDSLNQIRDQARVFANKQGFETEFEKLNAIISALLTTHSGESILKTEVGLASAKQEPFDVHRIALFKDLANYLKRCQLPKLPYEYNKSGWNHLAFFESYFSNYIEGTEFEIDEAEQIVFQRSEINNRHADSHDVLSIYDQVVDYQGMSITPETPDELIESLQRRHFEFLFERPDKKPGRFKSKVNKAGSSTFVSPDDVVGTLTQAFAIYKSVPEGLARAIFLQFLVSECHPFDDGNGRLSRIMMNAELHAAGEYKLIVPTVHRDSYLNGLRKATRDGNFKTLVKVFYQLQRYTASIDWADYGEARDTLEAHKAHLLPDEGIADFNRQIRQYRFTPPAS